MPAENSVLDDCSPRNRSVCRDPAHETKGLAATGLDESVALRPISPELVGSSDRRPGLERSADRSTRHCSHHAQLAMRSSTTSAASACDPLNEFRGASFHASPEPRRVQTQRGDRPPAPEFRFVSAGDSVRAFEGSGASALRIHTTDMTTMRAVPTKRS